MRKERNSRGLASKRQAEYSEGQRKAKESERAFHGAKAAEAEAEAPPLSPSNFHDHSFAREERDRDLEAWAGGGISGIPAEEGEGESSGTLN